MSHQLEFRDALVGFLETELVGPEKPDEVLIESPCRRYVAGILFPTSQAVIEAEDDEETKVDTGTNEQPGEPLFDAEQSPSEPRKAGGSEDGVDAVYDDTIVMANTFFPSAIGLSFICEIPADGLVVEAHASRYEARAPADPKNLQEWQRILVELKPVTSAIEPTQRTGVSNHKILDNLYIRVLHRMRKDGRALVTVSLYNTNKRSGRSTPSASDCFFQTGFSVRGASNQTIFHEYRSGDRLLSDPEESSLALLYRNRRAFAVGHGCAAEWGEEIDGQCSVIRTASIPSYTIAPVEPRQGDGDELSMHFLSGADDTVAPGQIISALQHLPNEYAAWIGERERELQTLPAPLRDAARRHLDDCGHCLQRIRDGIKLLGAEKLAFQAFKLANRAMLMQQVHSRRRRRQLDERWTDLPTDYKPKDERGGRWRTFQLAFLLMNIGSLMPPEGKKEREYRAVVDLIWFPTGGGKTEAYLGLTAYSIFLRRLIRPTNGGCTALMRYTLRLLTSQQFQRASSMICACELIRGADEKLLGKERISIGLWVGQSLAPNTRAEAIAAVNGLARELPEVENPFQVLTCPWCGTALDHPRHLGYVVRGRPATVLMICPDTRCPFSDSANPLPVFVVDEDIYYSPTSLIIGTVDKFAMLAWRPEAGAIFGLRSPQTDPPDLIIQDELHLISGPLGSMVGLYECAIDLLCSVKGRAPKIVGSTATIRRAKDQCLSLYNRQTFQFPPPGLDASDSFFAAENQAGVGRRYVGVFASGAPSFVTANVRVASSLLQGCRSLPLAAGADESIRDPYWTLLQYFSSLRELGRSATLVEADIPEYMWAMASRAHIPKELCRHVSAPVELTSRRSAQEIPEILARLSVSYPRDPDSDQRPIDTLLATNMISVGVDVERLGLMLILGQPKTTSEYIQASSRVGRSAKAPGLVVTLYNPGKPRDRSHFEHFRAYHSSFYRFVEPTSVTPFSLPVLQRSLHALLVIIARQLAGVECPDEFDERAIPIAQLRKFLSERCKAIDPEHRQHLETRLQALEQHWASLMPGEWGRFGVPPEARPLMYPAGTTPRPEWDDLSWSTPSSLRNVDVECEGSVLGMYPGPSEA